MPAMSLSKVLFPHPLRPMMATVSPFSIFNEILLSELNSETFLLPMVDGELVLFPSSLRHSVPFNKGNETRYSMSFNTFCIDELGSRDSLTHLNIKELYEKN